METVIKTYLDTVQQELQAFAQSLDVQAVEAVAKTIIEYETIGGRVHVTGVGKPGHVAGYVASLLSSTGTSAYELHATEAVHGSSGQVKANDVVIAISNSGETAELKATVETLIRNGAYVIGCTGNAASWLAKNTHAVLLAHVDQEGDSLNKPPRTSILAEMLILQALSVVLQEFKGLNPETYVKWHPGGSLGKSIQIEGEN